MSTYNVHAENDSQLKNANYIELDMKNSMLQNRLTRNEKILEEYERKNAFYSKSLKLISKYINALSNGAKRFIQKSLKVELASLVKLCNTNSDMVELIEILTDFVTGIKILKNKADDDEPIKDRSSMSVDFDKNSNYALEQLRAENQKLKSKLDKISKGELDCNNCHMKIDIKKILGIQNPLMLQSNVFSQIERHMTMNSLMQSKNMDISKFSDLRSLHSFLKEDKNENKKILNKLNHLNGQKDSLCIDDSSVFLKKNNMKSHNISAIPMLSINDTIDEIRVAKDKSCMNWIIKEIEDSEKTATEYSIQLQEETPENNEVLGGRNLLTDFNKVADSYQNSFSINNNPKSKEKIQMNRIECFEVDKKPTHLPKSIHNLQEKIDSISLSDTIVEESSNVIDKTLNSIDHFVPNNKKICNSNNGSDQRLLKSQETLKVEAVYAYRQKKRKASPKSTSVDSNLQDDAKVTKRISFIKNLDEAIFKSLKENPVTKQSQTVRNMPHKGFEGTKSGNIVTTRTKILTHNDRDDKSLPFNSSLGFQKTRLTAEDKNKTTTNRLSSKGQPVIRNLNSTERTLNNMISNNIARNSIRHKGKLAN